MLVILCGYMHIFMFHVLNPHSLGKTFLMLILVSFWLYTLLNAFKHQAEQLGLYMYKTFFISASAVSAHAMR